MGPPWTMDLANCGGIILIKFQLSWNFQVQWKTCVAFACMIVGFENKTCDKIGYDCNCHTFLTNQFVMEMLWQHSNECVPSKTMGFLWKHMVLREYSALITDVQGGLQPIYIRDIPYNFIGTSSQCPMPGASIQGFFEHQCLVHPRKLTCPLKGLF